MMLAMQLRNSMVMTGKVDFSRFVKIVLQAPLAALTVVAALALLSEGVTAVVAALVAVAALEGAEDMEGEAMGVLQAVVLTPLLHRPILSQTMRPQAASAVRLSSYEM